MQARGIHTSTGAGDHRRALATCERLALVAGDACPIERRDLGVLYAITGRMAEAAAELRFYKDSPSYVDLDSREKRLVDRLVEAVESESESRVGVECKRLTIESMLVEDREPWYAMTGPKYQAIPW